MEHTGSSEKRRGQSVARRKAAATLSLFQYLNFFLNALKGVVLLPVYLNFFSFEVYGAWIAASTLLQALGSLDGGLTMVLTQRLGAAAGARDQGRFFSYLTSGLVSYGAVVAVLMVVGVSLVPWVVDSVHIQGSAASDLRFAVYLAVVAFGLNLWRESVLSALMAQQKPLGPGVVRVGVIVANVAFTLAALASMRSVAALGVGNLLASMVGAGTAMLWVWNALRTEVKPGMLVFVRMHALDLLKTSSALIVSRVANSLAEYGETFLVASLVGPAVAGAFAVTSRLISLARAIPGPIASAAFAGIAHAYAEHGVARMRALVRELFSLSLFLTGITVPLALAINKVFVSTWVGTDKYAGDGVTIVLAFASALGIRLSLMGSVTAGLGVIRPMAWIGILHALVRISAMIVLIPLVGIIGVPLAFLLSGISVWFVFVHRLLAHKLELAWSAALALHVPGAIGFLSNMVLGVLILRFVQVKPSWTCLAVVAAGALVATGLTFALVEQSLVRGSIRTLLQLVPVRLGRKPD